MWYTLNLWRILLFYKTCPIQQLPKVPGLYYVVSPNRVLYVGLAGANRSNLYDRWNKYTPHKMAVHVNNDTVKLYYRPMARRQLQYTEACEIRCFNPPYNIQHPNPNNYRLWSDWWLLFFVTLITIIMFAT